jgi:hypothetical protein
MKYDKQSLAFLCSWKNNKLRRTKNGDRYFEQNAKYVICAALFKHCESIESFTVSNEHEMLNYSSIYNRPTGEAAVTSRCHCVLKVKMSLTLNGFKNFLKSLGIKSIDHAQLSVNINNEIKLVTKDDVRAVIYGFDTSLASSRWKAHIAHVHADSVSTSTNEYCPI